MKSTHNTQRPTGNLGENDDLLLLSKHLPLVKKQQQKEACSLFSFKKVQLDIEYLHKAINIYLYIYYIDLSIDIII